MHPAQPAVSIAVADLSGTGSQGSNLPKPPPPPILTTSSSASTSATAPTSASTPPAATPGPLSPLDESVLALLANAGRASEPVMPGLRLIHPAGEASGGGAAPVQAASTSGGGGGGGGGAVAAAAPTTNTGTTPSASSGGKASSASPAARTTTAPTGGASTLTASATTTKSGGGGHGGSIHPDLPQPTGSLLAVNDNATNRNFYGTLTGETFNTDAYTGVLENDQYIEAGDTLVANYVGGSLTAGTLNPFPDGALLESDGRFSYTPPAGFTGTVTFNYFDTEFFPNGTLRATSNTATVTITVGTPATMPPVPIVTNPPAAVSPWPTFHGDPARDGAAAVAYVPSGAFTGTNLLSPLVGSPTTLSGAAPMVFIGDQGGDLHALSTPTGAQVWLQHLGTNSFQFGQAPALGVDTGGGLHLYASSVGGYFSAFTPLTGALQWRFSLPSPAKFYASPLIVSDTIGGVTFSRIVVGSDESWSAEHPGGGPSLGSARGFRQDGTVAWQALLPGRITYGAAKGPAVTGHSDTVVVGTDAGAGETTGHFYLLDAQTGMVLAQRNQIAGAVTATPAVNTTTGAIYVAHGNHLEGVTAAAGAGGSIVFTDVAGFPLALVNPIHSTPAINAATGNIYFGDDGGILHGRTAAGATLFDLQLSGGAIQNAPLQDPGTGNLYFGTAGPLGNFYGVSPAGAVVLAVGEGSNFSFGTSSVAVGTDAGGTHYYIGSGSDDLVVF
jgi:hypothetical protein